MHTMRVHCAPPIDQSLSPSHRYPLGTHALIANPSPYINGSVCVDGGRIADQARSGLVGPCSDVPRAKAARAK